LGVSGVRFGVGVRTWAKARHALMKAMVFTPTPTTHTTHYTLHTKLYTLHTRH